MKTRIQMVVVFLIVLIMTLLVSAEAVAQSRSEIVNMIRESAVRHDVNPDLAVAIATVESGLDPDAIGSKGELGVFQLRPEYHAVRPGNVRQNVEIAILYLSEIRYKWESTYGDAWFIKYNLGPNYRQIKYPRKFAYYQKVMAAKSRTIASK